MRLRFRLAAHIGRNCALASIATAGLLATGCAVTVPDPAASVAHPANPRAAEAPAPTASTTLAVGSGLESQRPAEPSVEPAPATYTCPMHPEVKSNAPGKCPKCGMKLQPAPKKTPKGGTE